MSLASARDPFFSRGCSRRRSHEAARALTALARPAEPAWDTKNCPRTDDPFGREPIPPTLANPMQLWAGEAQPVPFVSSNDISTFSILDTGMGAVRSFAVNLRDPQAEAIEFDRFMLDTRRGPRR